MTAQENIRLYAGEYRSAHLVPGGEGEALCGFQSRPELPWLAAPGRLAVLPDCRRCASRARFLAEVAAWQGPPPRPGVVAMVTSTGGGRCPAAECARCGRLERIERRGLCVSCERSSDKDGTITGYGWQRPDRLAEYAEHRQAGLDIGAAAGRLGVSKRTAQRYETALAAEGRAPWRATDPALPAATRASWRAAA